MITAYLKLSDLCSVGCDHCYLPLEKRENGAILTDEILLQRCIDIEQLATINETKSIDLVLHGGEPTSLPIDLVREKVGLVRDWLVKKGFTIYGSMQTAGLHVDKQWTEFAKEFCGGHIGISFDNSTRQLGGSSERYKRLLSKRIKFMKNEGCSVGATIVPSTLDIGHEVEILDWLTENKISNVTIDRYSNYKRPDPLKPSNLEHSHFLIELTKGIISQISNGQRAPYFGAIIAAINGVAFGLSGDRWGTQCLEQFIVIGEEGKTNHCPDKISYDKNFNKDGAFVLSEDRFDAVFAYKVNNKNIYCDTCEYYDWCRTGCPIMSNNFISEGDCSGLKVFLNFIKQQLENKQLKKRLLKYADYK